MIVDKAVTRTVSLTASVQVEVSSSDDELVAVMAKFRHTLFSIPLPPPAAVDYEQALKDAQRECIEASRLSRLLIG